VVRDLSSLSRVVSHALRHEPWLYELELDDDGWADIGALLEALRGQSQAWQNLSGQDLAEMIENSPKRRHEIAGGRIRALYGHSLAGKLRRERTAPPEWLFHGTAPASRLKIEREGLLPMGRQYVHLSAERGDAVAVGRRKSSEPIVLVIKAREAWNAGVVFYAGNEKVWLADHVPPMYLDFEACSGVKA
jgi:putative RNA 2'-phosphotransferase